ncbi:hypothetical protein PV11_03408 [Exophiala sideris]|uniref:DUF8035 domain-containing protein n=1 Tax=Exophiala sideris TaxID=1016849 RepID=A0A0D1YZ31_9EURO|nr:hypothetical protein PV11_03408 [Exophiala sideris]
MSGISQEVHEAVLDISSATHRCYGVLRQCLNTPLLMEHEWAENRLADFTLWASGIGAAAAVSDKISLDARLAGKPALINIFVQLLQMLLGFLARCQNSRAPRHDRLEEQPENAQHRFRDLSPARGRSHDRNQPRHKSRSISPWSDQSSLGSEPDAFSVSDDTGLAEAMRGVDSILSQLNNLSIAVRRTGNQLRLRKADSRFDRSEHSDLEAFLKVWVLAHTNSDPLKAMDDTDRLTPIQRRLVEVNLIRRNRFLYAQRHSRKMAIERRALDEGVQPTSTESPLANNLVAAIEQLPKLEKEPRTQDKLLAKPLGSPADNTTATRLGATTEILKEKPLPQESQITSTAARIRYPDPPKLGPHVNFFKCPCCCQTLSRALVSGNLWRKHLIEDICPYTCIHPKCPQPGATWSTRQAWLDHMYAEDHYHERFWQCLICADDNAYTTRAELLTHTSECHPEIVADQIETLLNASVVRMANDQLPCPLCRPDTAVAYNMDHIAEHIHAFALLSLPWAPDVPVIEERTWQESCQKVMLWLGVNEQVTFRFERDSFLQRSTVDETSLYFEGERYFAEIAEKHSQSDSFTSESGQVLIPASQDFDHVPDTATSRHEDVDEEPGCETCFGSSHRSSIPPGPSTEDRRNVAIPTVMFDIPVDSQRNQDRWGAGSETASTSSDRPRRVQLVEPVEKKGDVKPKGILKPPRAVPFPEDPHPEREGVAPLKDTTKHDIPANARWTKISRALVIPEALEKARERFEERDDDVIVLRVLTREEIIKLAENTKEIREARERQWQAEHGERSQSQAEHGETSQWPGEHEARSLSEAEHEERSQWQAEHEARRQRRKERGGYRESTDDEADDEAED